MHIHSRFELAGFYPVCERLVVVSDPNPCSIDAWTLEALVDRLH